MVAAALVKQRLEQDSRRKSEVAAAVEKEREKILKIAELQLTLEKEKQLANEISRKDSEREKEQVRKHERRKAQKDVVGGCECAVS